MNDQSESIYAPEALVYDKISLKKRQEVVRLILDEKLSIRKAAKRVGIKKSTAEKILRRFKVTGTFFEPKDNKKSHSSSESCHQRRKQVEREEISHVQQERAEEVQQARYNERQEQGQTTNIPQVGSFEWYVLYHVGVNGVNLMGFWAQTRHTQLQNRSK